MSTLLYVGSSTIANFIREAEPVYGRARFHLDTAPESAGGERAIQDRYADLAGVAREPAEESIDRGLQATLIGTDTIAVIVNEKNPVTKLTLPQLKRVFSGKTKNWKELGGPDLPITPLIVAPESATLGVFRSVVLGVEDYSGCRVVRPDPDMPMQVEAEPGAVGIVSFSFVCSGGVVRLLAIDGESPLPSNESYPIARPLYLLWWPENPKVAEFIDWIRTAEGERVLTKCFGKPRSFVR